MTADILLCGSNPALTLVGGATLDMHGHTLTCTGGNVGIHVIGNAAKLINGKISGCTNGVVLDGGGAHRLTDMALVGNSEGATVIAGNNRLKRVTGEASSGANFGIYGSGNLFTDCVAIGSATNAGFALVNSPSNVFKRCTSSENASYGFHNDGGDYNRFISCGAHANAGQGFLLTTVLHAIVRNSFATNNGNHGIELLGSGLTTVQGNVSEANGLDGIVVNGANGNKIVNNIVSRCRNGINVTNAADHNAVFTNFVTKNTLAGITVTNATFNQVYRNDSTVNDVGITATTAPAAGNTTFVNVTVGDTFRDLADLTGCAGTTWTSDVYATKLNGCEF